MNLSARETLIAAIGAAGILASAIYFAGVQGNRLDTIQANQQHVLLKLDELTKSDVELKLEFEKLKSRLEAKGIHYSLRDQPIRD